MKKIFFIICFVVCFVSSVSASSDLDNNIKSIFNNISLSSDAVQFIENYDFSDYNYYYEFPYSKNLNSFELIICNWDQFFTHVNYQDNNLNSLYYLNNNQISNYNRYIRIVYNNGYIRFSEVTVRLSSIPNRYNITYNGNLYYYTENDTFTNLFIDSNFNGVVLYSYNNISEYPYPYSNINTVFIVSKENTNTQHTEIIYNNNTHIGFKYTGYSSDTRLKIYETESITGKVVNFNLSEFLSSSSHSSTSISDDLVVTVNYDGTDQTFTFNSENANILSSSDTYIVQVPLSTFGIDDFDDVMISQVYFTDTLFTQSSEPVITDHYISTSYYLKHETEEIIVPSISPPATIYDDVKTQEQIDNIVNQLNEQGSQYDYTTGKFSFVSDVPDFPDWAETYEFNVIFSRSGSDLSLFDTWHRMNGNSYSLIDWATSTFNAVDFYEDNKAWSHADVVIITVYSVIVTLDPNDPNNFLTIKYEFEGFLVWKSDRYYDHQNSYTLIDILDGLQRIGNQQIENWTWLADNLYNLEVLVIDGLTDLIRIDRDNLSWLKTIDVNLNNGVDSIVAAIENISFPAVSGGFSLADLSNELKSLFVPTKTWADLGYDDYKDSLGVLALPFEFTFDSLDIIKDSSNYSPNFELHVNPLSVDIPDIDGSTKNFEVFVESDISMSPTSVFPASVWNTLQYFNLFTLVVVQALITYNHIFGGEER